MTLLRCTLCTDEHQQLYAVLGVPSSASQQEIKSAYKRLVHSLHPDKHQQAQVSHDTRTLWRQCSVLLRAC